MSNTEGRPMRAHDFAADLADIASIEAIPTLLDVVCRTTGMGFAAVARVTEHRWVACAVRDDIAFGLQPGGELKVATTICHEIRQSRTAVMIDHVAADGAYCGHLTPALYGFQSYVSMPIVMPDGTFFGTLCAIDPKPAQVSRPEVVGMFKLFADLIAFHLDAHRRVAMSAVRRDLAWRNSQDLQAVVDGSGIIRAANQAWHAILGWQPEEVIGRSHLDFNHPEHQAASAKVLADSATQAIPAYETRNLHKDGSDRWIAWVAAPEGGLIYASGRDVTREKSAAAELLGMQEQLRQAQKMEAVGQLTGGVAHDFNNLLTVIKSSTDLLKRPDLAEERRQRYIGAISDTVDRAARLTGQLLAFARRQALKPEVFAVGDSVRAIGEMMGTLTGSRIGITTDLSEETCLVDADPSQFDTALVNMAVNARDAMGGEGRLVIGVRPVELMPAVRRQPAVRGAFVAVSVTDTGCGIPAGKLEQIFEPFYTTKGVGEGTGLGLSQVFGFAKQSGGEVTVESEEGRGTTFTLYLPRVHEKGQAADVGEPEPLVDGHGTCVLVVEDNVDVGTFATQTLAELGYRATWAAGADEALTRLAEDADRFDVVFSDVVMPGMNGVDLAQEIRRRHPGLPVVLTSGYSHVLAQNGTYGFELLHKPYSVEQLSRVLRKAATWQRRKRILER